LRSQEHHHGESRREDKILTRVQESKRRRDLDGSFFIVLQRFVEFGDFMALVVKVL